MQVLYYRAGASGDQVMQLLLIAAFSFTLMRTPYPLSSNPIHASAISATVQMMEIATLSLLFLPANHAFCTYALETEHRSEKL